MRILGPCAILATVVLAATPLPAYAQATTLTLRNVMAGNSSSGSDQVWVRADNSANPNAGVAAECVYQGWSLFYSNNNGDVSPEKVEAIALTAKTTATPVFIAYVVETNPSDFWGWGITRCRILRISLGA